MEATENDWPLGLSLSEGLGPTATDVDLWAEIHRLRAMLHEVLEFQSDPKAPTIHDFGRWRRAADGLGLDGRQQMQADDARYRRVRDSVEGYAALSACRFMGSSPTDADSAVDATMETRPVLGGA